MCFGVLSLATLNLSFKALSDRYTMLNGAAFHSLLMAVVCLSSWASPLGRTIPPAGNKQQRVLGTHEPPGEGHVETSPGTPLQKDSRFTEADMITRTPSASLYPESTRVYLPLLVPDSSDHSFNASAATLNTSVTATSGNTNSKPDLLTTGVSSELPQSSAPAAPHVRREEEEAVVGSSVYEGVGGVTADGNGGRQSGLDDRAVCAQTESVDELQNTPVPDSEESSVDHVLLSVNDTITRTPSVLLKPSTTGLFSLSALTSVPAASHTSLTITSRDSVTGLVGVEIQDSTPLSVVRQPDRTFSSRTVNVAEVWTEADHLQKAEVSVDSWSQELDAEVTMSSEDLPLIFEPFEEVSPPRSSALVFELPVAIEPTAVTVENAELEQMVSMETDHISSNVPLSGTLDWPSSWQMSGSEKTNSFTPSDMQIKGPVTESDHAAEHHGKTPNDDIIQTSVTQQTVTTSEVVQLLKSTPKTDTEDAESKEKADEDEEDEGLDSDEEESEEDLTETTMAAPNRPPHSLIPSPPVWVQRNQGLVRSWVELIREKAGYVSGMLAPVGIGIAGALLLVGALYSIRVIHRKRREKFRHERRRPPREVCTGPDNTMLLADSSEDEF